MSKRVMLGWASTQFEVTESGYELIKQLIKQHQVCPKCNHQTNDTDRLLVGKYCLACMLSADPSLTFVGQSGVNSEGFKIYSFHNEAGITLTSKENDDTKPVEDIALSITSAGFSVPTSYKPFKSTEVIQLYASGWKVFGKLDQSVVIIQYTDTRYGKKTLYVAYIAYKGGQTIELNKRTTEHKNLLEKAQNLAERTKKGGYYNLNGGKFKEIEETHLYPLIARLEAASYNEQLLFLQAQQEEDTEPQITLLDVSQDEPVQEAVQDSVQEQDEKPKRKLRVVKEESNGAE